MPCKCKKGTAVETVPVPEYITSSTGGDTVTVAARETSLLKTPSGDYRLKSGRTLRLAANEANGLIEAGAPIWILQVP